MSALVTVFVTVYNIQDYLPRFFESMKNQSFKDYKLLILEDGSTDNSLKICQEFAKHDDRIEIIELPHIGISAARNLVKEYVKTPFLASADGDDYVEPTYLSNLVEGQLRSDADLVISRVIYRNEKDLTEQGIFKERGELYIPRSEFVEKLPMLLDDRRLNFLYAKLYRTELFNKVEIESNVKPGSDTMMNCRFLKYCNSIFLIDSADYNYIKYSARAVTSRQDAEIFGKLMKLNQFVRSTMTDNGFMSDEMQLMIDKRILLSAIWMIDGLIDSNAKDQDKEKQVDLILSNIDYIAAYQRSNQILDGLALSPQTGKHYLSSLKKREKLNRLKAKILRFTPSGIHNLYLKIK